MVMKKSFLFFFLAFFFGESNAQPDCVPGTFEQRIHANNISANLSVKGNLFRENSDPAFNVPFDLENRVATIYTAGLCIVGKDPAENLKASAMFYGINGINGSSDYWPGPLTNIGSTTTEDCANWDRLWKVEKYEVYNHLADFNDNGIIDDPISAIYKWPGAGNPNFESMNGFVLPGLPQGYAPFWDQNGDGIYNPSLGDYPIAPNTNQEAFPEQLFWGVFNDAGNVHTQFEAPAIGMEVQFSAWAYTCEAENDLNNSIFISYKLINRSVELFKEAKAGLFVDFDLGCYEDDYIGCIPEKNTFYAYNADNIDGAPIDNGGSSCDIDVPTFQGKTPTQAVTILNGELDYFAVMDAGTNSISEQSTPLFINELENYMNGFWRDGLPFTMGGNGYDSLQLTASTNHIYDGNPNDETAWSMFAENLVPENSDLKALSSTIIPDLSPGQSTELAFVFTYFDDEGNDHLQNVQSIYDRVDFLQEGYDQGMLNACDYQQICIEDCVWPGDTNQDGIANHLDLLPIITNIGESGPERLNYPTWAPKFAENWSQNGTKHVDANGDGLIEVADVYTSDLHYYLVTPDYEEPEATYPLGDNVYVELGGGSDIDNLDFGELTSIWVKLRNVENLHALAYTLEYDPTFFSAWIPTTNLSRLTVETEKISLARPNSDGFDYALGKVVASYDFEGTTINAIVVKINPDLANQVLESNQTQIRFRNLIGLDADGNDLNIGAGEIFLTIPGITVATKEIELEGLKIFPNPTSGIVTVESPNEIIDQVIVYDISGKKVNSYLIGTPRKELNLNHLGKGMYFLELTTTNGKYTSKLILN